MRSKSSSWREGGRGGGVQGVARLHRAEGKMINEPLSAETHVHESLLLFSIWGLLHYCEGHCLSVCLSTGEKCFLDGLPSCRREINPSGVVQSSNRNMRRTCFECSDCESIVGSCVSVFLVSPSPYMGAQAAVCGTSLPLPLPLFPSRFLAPFQAVPSCFPFG